MTGTSPNLSELANPDAVRVYIKAISDYLTEQRGFTKKPQLLLVFETGSEATKAPQLHGIYFEKGEHEGYPQYQKIRIESNSRCVCSGVYIFWGHTEEGWKIGKMDERALIERLKSKIGKKGPVTTTRIKLGSHL